MFDNFGADRFSTTASVNENRSSFLAPLPFFVELPSTIGTASAVVLRPSFGPMFDRARASPLGAGAGAAVVDKSNQVIQTTHRALSRNRSDA